MNTVLIVCVDRGTRDNYGPLSVLLEGEAEWKSHMCVQVRTYTRSDVHKWFRLVPEKDD